MNGGMNETTTAKKEKTYVNYLSEKKRNKAIYAMLPYYENVIILGASLAESILDYRLLRKKNVIAKRGRCVDMIEGDIQRALSLIHILLRITINGNKNLWIPLRIRFHLRRICKMAIRF